VICLLSKSGSSEDSEEYDATEFHGFINPVGRKVMKVELALMRNATEELDSEELEVVSRHFAHETSQCQSFCVLTLSVTYGT
jgi:hypothetical protein